MTRFVSVVDASEFWRAGVEFEDSPPISVDTRAPRLILCIEQAESIVLNYLKVTEDSPLWEPEDADLPNLQAAILIIGQCLYDEDYEGQAKAMDGMIPLLLMRMRDPALA